MLTSSCVALLASVAIASVDPILISPMVTVYSDGSYAVHGGHSGGLIARPYTSQSKRSPSTWMKSTAASPAALRSVNGSRWRNLSLAAVNGPTMGSDTLGVYDKVTFTWKGGQGWSTSVRAYRNHTIVVFGQVSGVGAWRFITVFSSDMDAKVAQALVCSPWHTQSHNIPHALSSLLSFFFVLSFQVFSEAIDGLKGDLTSDRPQSEWPALSSAEPKIQLGYLGFRGCMSGDIVTGTFPTSSASRPTTATPTARASTSIGGEVSNLALQVCSSSSSSSSSSNSIGDGGNKRGDGSLASTAQEWKFLEKGMLENLGNQQCLQVGKCDTADDAKVAADVACKPQSMCNGRNLEWNYSPVNASLMNVATGKCITIGPAGSIQQATCSPTDSSQKIYYDQESGKTVCLRLLLRLRRLLRLLLLLSSF